MRRTGARRATKVLALLLMTGSLVLLGASSATAQYNPSNGALTVSDQTPSAGGRVTVSGAGFAANGQVIVTIESTPQELGRTTANASGQFSLAVTVPASFTGSHTIKAVGAAPDGSIRTLSVAVTVQGATVARTGSNVIPLAIAGGAAIVLGVGLVTRSRRRSAAA